jgi:hypothetical protein
VVAYLGDLAPSEQDGWVKLGAHLHGDEAAAQPARTLFDPPCARVADGEEQVKVRLKDIRLERLRDFGDVWLAWGLWRMLGLDGLLAKLLPQGREDVPWGTVAAILAIARFCEPSSELYIEQKWYRRTALEDLLGLERKHGSLNRVWVMDRGMVSKDYLEFLRQRDAKYIVGTPKSLLREFERELTEQNWVTAQEGVDVKLVPGPDGKETFLLARSVDRRAKELAMHKKFIGHMEAGLQKLRALEPFPPEPLPLHPHAAMRPAGPLERRPGGRRRRSDCRRCRSPLPQVEGQLAAVLGMLEIAAEVAHVGVGRLVDADEHHLPRPHQPRNPTRFPG